MPRYNVYEAQEETCTRLWLYKVEASSPEDAIARVKAGESEPENAGVAGEEGYGPSVYAAAPEGDPTLWSEVAERLVRGEGQ